MHFFDISNVPLTDLIIKDSKLPFGAFRNCDMKNVKFENCDIYWGGFYNHKISQTIFSKCNIELTVFENIQFDKTRMEHCFLRLSAILNSNATSVDISTSTKSRFITDLSQLTPQDIEEAIKETMGHISKFDTWIRLKIKDIMHKDIERYGFEKYAKDNEQNRGAYDKAQFTYGEVKSMVEAAFGIYGQDSLYKTKHAAYEKKGVYK